MAAGLEITIDQQSTAFIAEHARFEHSGSGCTGGISVEGHTSKGKVEADLAIHSFTPGRTGTFNCHLIVYDFSIKSGYVASRDAGTCSATVTNYGPIGGTIEGTVSGNVKKTGSGNTVVPFNGRFSVVRGGDRECLAGSPPT